MTNKIEHIGIAVKDLEKAKSLYSVLLGTEAYKMEEVEREKVITLFFKTGESKIELLAATSPVSNIARFINESGEGLHHIAFEVKDIAKEMERLKEMGFNVLSAEPMPGADNKLVCFIHPKSANGVLIELCQEKPTV
jgi:methylmalonyl-CoA/ethylmalonyl-CoA epimerase